MRMVFLGSIDKTFEGCFKILAFVLFAFFLGVGCKTGHKEENKGNLDQLQTRESSQPEVLWSPKRRESTANFYFLLAEDFRLRGQREAASKLYTQAYLLDANSLLAAKMIEAEAENGDSEQAKIDAERMAILYPRSAELRFLNARIQALQGFWKEAEKEMEEAIRLDPSGEEFYLGLAGLHLNQKSTSQAVKTLERLLKERPLSLTGLVLLARLYLSTNRPREALGPAKRAYEMQTSNVETVVVYALALEQNKQTKQALNLYEALYKMTDQSGPILERMAELYESIGNLEESLSLLKELREDERANKEAIDQQIAIVLWGLSRFEEAADLLKNLNERVPDNDRVSYMAGVALGRVERDEESQTRLESISKTSPFYAAAQTHLAYLAGRHDNLKLAEQHLRSALEREPDSEEALLLLASVLSDQNRSVEAAKLLVDAFESYPTKVKLLFYSAVYLEKAEKRQDSVVLLRKLLTLSPDMHAALNFLAYLLVERDDVLEGRKLGVERAKEALDLINKALSLQPKDGFYLDTRAWAYYRLKNYSAALKDLSEALKIAPGEGVILEHMGDVYLALNQTTKAFDYYSEALKAKNEKRDQERIQRKWDDLKSRINPS